jgi:DNA segregation ATPase FtsK/SpoIIIE, S-DNA-T family
MGNKTNPIRANTFREESFAEEIIIEENDKKQGKKDKPEKPAKPVKPPKEKKPAKPKKKRDFRVLGLFFLVFGAYLLFALTSFMITWQEDFSFTNKIFTDFSWKFLFAAKDPVENWMGKIGAITSYLFIYSGIGVASFIFVILFLLIGIKLMLEISVISLQLLFKYSFFCIIWIPVMFSVVMPDEKIFFGIYGYEVNKWLTDFLGEPGLILLLIFSFLSFTIIAFNIPFRWFKKKEKNIIPLSQSDAPVIETPAEEMNPEQKSIVLEEGTGNRFIIDEEDAAETLLPDTEIQNETHQVLQENDTVEFQIEKPVIEPGVIEDAVLPVEHFTIDTKFDPTLELRGYKFPPLDLLNDYGGESISINNEELSANKNRIVETLNNYSIKIVKIKATIGPAVTLYEIVPEPGVRISKIKNLENDIALSLAALGIRIIAPIPGKGTIGIEVPNQNPEIVSIKSLLSSEKFQKSGFELPFVLGKTIANETFIADLTKMPHILMAGATGQGKSVGLNTIITSLLYKKHPSLVKFVMIDPKKVELSLFTKIERHYLAKLPDSEEAIITDTKKVIRTLNSLNIEMDNRYDLLQDAQVRNIREYNEKFISRKLNPNDNHHFLPYIIVFVDEFADLIMTAGREIETPITRLAQLARAVGIHLVIATQRPSVNIITGTIKANFPVRIAFKVASKIDSRTILDQSGADQLVGRGDMLLSMGSDLIRLQCAFVDTPEIEKVTDFIGSQRGFPEVYALPEFYDEESEATKEFDSNQKDELFADAARMIVQHQQGSTSLLQRKLKLGYNRAGRIIDQLESAGIVGPFEGSKAREVRYKDLNSLEQHLKDLGEY